VIDPKRVSELEAKLHQDLKYLGSESSGTAQWRSLDALVRELATLQAKVERLMEKK
jgi:hypothetical protein